MTYDPHKSTTEVRQGSGRRMNLRAMVIGLVVLIIAFAAIWIWYSTQTPPSAMA